MKMLYFKFHQNRPINEEFDCWGFKGPRGFQGTPISKIRKTAYQKFEKFHMLTGSKLF